MRSARKSAARVLRLRGGKGKTRAGMRFLAVDGKLERLKKWDTGLGNGMLGKDSRRGGKWISRWPCPGRWKCSGEERAYKPIVSTIGALFAWSASGVGNRIIRQSCGMGFLTACKCARVWVSLWEELGARAVIVVAGWGNCL